MRQKSFEYPYHQPRWYQKYYHLQQNQQFEYLVPKKGKTHVLRVIRELIYYKTEDIQNHFGDEEAAMAQFIFYYAGHGVKDTRGNGWLALHGYNNKNAHTKFKMEKLIY